MSSSSLHSVSGSDDDERPEEVSFHSEDTAKEQQKLVQELKKKDKDLIKEKRRQQQDLYKKQKQDKAARSNKLIFNGDVLDQIRNERAQIQKQEEGRRPPAPAPKTDAVSYSTSQIDENKNSINVGRKVITKTYKDLNIDVKSLNEIRNPRRSAAVSFRNRRFGKIHRESVSMNLIHVEKLKAAGKL